MAVLTEAVKMAVLTEAVNDKIISVFVYLGTVEFSHYRSEENKVNTLKGISLQLSVCCVKHKR